MDKQRKGGRERTGLVHVNCTEYVNTIVTQIYRSVVLKYRYIVYGAETY